MPRLLRVLKHCCFMKEFEAKTSKPVTRWVKVGILTWLVLMRVLRAGKVLKAHIPPHAQMEYGLKSDKADENHEL